MFERINSKLQKHPGSFFIPSWEFHSETNGDTEAFLCVPNYAVSAFSSQADGRIEPKTFNATLNATSKKIFWSFPC